MALHSTIPAIWLLGLSFLITPRTASGQTSDSAPATTSDSQAAADSLARDTLAGEAPGQTADTALKTAGSDTTRATTGATVDSASQQQSRDTAKAETADVYQSRDSVLLGSCRTPAGAGVASDLLVVVFAPEAGADQRAAAANHVDGTLVGSVPGDPGAYYLRVPGGGGEHRLRAAADELIQMPEVRQVGSRSCPRS